VEGYALYTLSAPRARARARAAIRAVGGPYAWRREKSEWLIRRPEGLDAGAAGRVEEGPADAAGLGRAHVRVREAPGRQAEKRASGAVAGAAARGWRRRRSGSRLEAGLGSGHSLAEVAPHPGDRANRIAVGPCSHDWGKGYPRPAAGFGRLIRRPADGALSRPDVAEGALSGATPAQGREKAPVRARRGRRGG
jgi:hypothetical protein